MCQSHSGSQTVQISQPCVGSCDCCTLVDSQHAQCKTSTTVLAVPHLTAGLSAHHNSSPAQQETIQESNLVRRTPGVEFTRSRTFRQGCQLLLYWHCCPGTFRSMLG